MLITQGTASRARGNCSLMRCTFLSHVGPDTGRDGKDVFAPDEKPDKMSLAMIVDSGFRERHDAIAGVEGPPQVGSVL